MAKTNNIKVSFSIKLAAVQARGGAYNLMISGVRFRPALARYCGLLLFIVGDPIMSEPPESFKVRSGPGVSGSGGAHTLMKLRQNGADF